MFGRKNARIAELTKERDAFKTEAEGHQRDAVYWEGACGRMTDKLLASRKECYGKQIALTAAENQLAAANAKLKPFLDRRALATRNLKQFQPKAGDGGTQVIQPKANGAAAQAVVS